MFESDLGKLIKQIRKIEGMTQEQLAELLDVSQSAIVKYELNQSKPGLDFVKAFKDRVGYDLTAKNITKVVSRETSEEKLPGTSPADLQVAVRELSEATNRHSKIDEVNARNMDRLLNILEKIYGIEKGEPPAMDLPELGGERVVDIREKSKKNQPKK